MTFNELVKVWHEREQVGRKANISADETKSFVEFHCKARFGNRPAGTIRYEEIDDVLTVLRDEKKQGPTAKQRPKMPQAASRLHRARRFSRRNSMNTCSGCGTCRRLG